MSRSDEARLADIDAACQVIAGYVRRDDAGDQIVFDAIRIRLVEIGEAVKDLDVATRASVPEIPWAEIARMRDLLTHRYFDTTHSVVMATVRNDIPLLHAAVEGLLGR